MMTASREGTASKKFRPVAAAISMLVLFSCGISSGENERSVKGEVSEASYQSTQIESAVLDTVFCEGTEAICGLEPIQDVVLENQNAWVLARGVLYRIDSAGVPLIMANPGGGPGELRAPIAIGDAGEGRTGATIFDLANARLSTFALSQPREETSIVAAPYFRNMRIRAGSLYAYTMLPAAALGETVTEHIVQYAVGRGGWTDTIARFSDQAVSVTGSEGQALPRLPWDQSLLWDVCRDGSALVGFNSRWMVMRFGNGDQRSVDSLYRPDFRAEVMSDDEHGALSAQALETAPRLPAFRDAFAKRLSKKPNTRPALQKLFCTDAGSAVLVNSTMFGSYSYVVDVVENEGGVERRLKVPANVRLLGAYGNWLAGVQETDDGRSTVVRVRLLR